MITIKQLKDLLQSSLNALADDFVFIINANCGKYEVAKQTGRKLPKPVVNCILRPLQSTVVPVMQLGNFYTQLQFDLLVPEKLIDSVQSVLMQFIESNAGAAGVYGEYAYVINMNLPDLGVADISLHVGASVQITTSVYYQFIKNGVLSNNCKLKLDGEELLTLDSATARARINQTDNTENSEEMQTVITQQGLQFNLTLPYLMRPKLEQLVKEIHLGKLGDVHTLEYDDGLIKSGANNPVWLVTLKDGSVSYQAGKVPTITASFLLAREDLLNV